MFQRILVPLDGSPGTERSIPIAARIARGADGSLVFFYVVPPSVALGKTSFHAREAAPEVEREERALADAANYLAEVIAAHREELAGVSTEMDVAFGLTSPMVASTARLEQVDLIVMCNHREAGPGQGGIESIAQQTMRRSPVPLLILNEHGLIPQFDTSQPLRVIVPLDGSLFAEAALEPALHIISQLASSPQDELCLVRIVEDRCAYSTEVQNQAWQEAEHYLQALYERLGKMSRSRRTFSIAFQVRAGDDVARALLEEAKETGSSHVMVMATHGREGVQRLLLGSVAERVLGAATDPLLIVCPGLATSTKTKPGQHAAGKM